MRRATLSQSSRIRLRRQKKLLMMLFRALVVFYSFFLLLLLFNCFLAPSASVSNSQIEELRREIAALWKENKQLREDVNLLKQQQSKKVWVSLIHTRFLHYSLSNLINTSPLYCLLYFCCTLINCDNFHMLRMYKVFMCLS